MCNRCSQGPRDALNDAARAFEGLRDLLCDATGRDKRQYEAVGPDGLFAIVSLIDEKLRIATAGMDNYVPRGWTPPQG